MTKWLFILASLVSFNAQARCLSDYHVNQKFQAHGLSAQQIAKAASFAQDPANGWRYLAQFHDPYAALAAGVVQPTTDAEQKYGKMIRRHWVNVVGADLAAVNFKKFARRHYQQYVEVLSSGTWPDADQILNSYLGAARALGLPELIVFDAAWEKSNYALLVSWQTLNQLPAERRTNSLVCPDVTRAQANRVIRRDLAPF